METISNRGIQVKVSPSIGGLADFLAAYLVKSSAKAGPGLFLNLALSGGDTPGAVFRALAGKYRDKINWAGIRVFWVDERCVPPSSGESNYNAARANLLKRINIPGENVFRIKGERPPLSEAARYSALADGLLPRGSGGPRFDLLLLGLGEDGHTASIFPGNIGLFGSKRLFEVSRHPETGRKRVTATGRLINSAAQVFFLVTGERKADRAAQIIERRPGWRALPAARVRPVSGSLTWLLDTAAAKKLKKPRPRRSR